MVLNITYSEAVRLIRCMGDNAQVPFNPNYKWFAFYAGKDYPSNTVYGLYSKNEDGLMGIIAREKAAQYSQPEAERVGA